MSDAATEKSDKRLLVVDDEEGPRESLNMIFGDDYDVTTAASGEEADDRAVVDAARAAGVPVNAVDRPEVCDFYVGALVNRHSHARVERH